MADVKNLREKLEEYRFEFDLLQKVDCKKEEQKEFKALAASDQGLPDGVFEYKDMDGKGIGSFYRIYKTDFTQDEIKEYLQFIQLSYLRTIKNCLIFFVVLTIIAIFVSWFLLLL